MVIHDNFTRGGSLLAIEKLQQRGFAGAGGASQKYKVPSLNLEANIDESLTAVAVGLGDLSKRHHWLGF